jgi:hypothetical protein
MKSFTVFVSSPGDVQRERNLLARVIDEVNQTHGIPLNYRLNLWRYEDQAYPSASKPQELINAIQAPYDLFIGIMWKRFGTSTPNAGSGTQEEYNIAYELWQQKRVLDIMFYFSNKPVNPAEIDFDQLNKVDLFRKKLAGNSFVWHYKNPVDFEAIIRKHLCLKMAEVMKSTQSNGQTSKAIPDTEGTATLRRVWNHMTPELQAFLSMPYNENRMRGDGGVKTKDLFAAMMSRPTLELQAVMRHIPAEALPEPMQGELVDEPYIATEQPWLSHCIKGSLHRLGNVLRPGQQLSALDVFIDIARNGTGESVALLRKHHITPEKIDAILHTEKLRVISAT